MAVSPFNRQSDSNLTYGRSRNLTVPQEIIGSMTLNVPKNIGEIPKHGDGIRCFFYLDVPHPESHCHSFYVYIYIYTIYVYIYIYVYVCVSISQVGSGVNLHA